MDVEGWIESLALEDGGSLDDAERIATLTKLEALKAAAAAAQARVTVAFDRSQRSQARRGTKTGEISRSIASQVALARRDSPSRGQQHLGVALALVNDMPQAHDELTRGEISEWRATLLVRETATLSREDRRRVDTELAGRLRGVGDRRVADLARAIGQRLDPGAALRRRRKAEGDRRVSIRPAPDTMSNVTGLLPVAQGVAVYATLRKHADSLRAAGDHRSIGQIMADTFYARLTGQESATPDVEVQLVMSERTLLRGDHSPAYVPGYGSIPGALARRLVREADRVWLRRLFTAPQSGELVAMDSRRRTFRGKLRQLVVLRDQVCRTPWCDAPIAHVDHARGAGRGGSTTAANAQGLCEACNYTKETIGWRVDVIRDPDRHRTRLTTPTGHQHDSSPPRQPGTDPPFASVEQHLRRWLGDVA